MRQRLSMLAVLLVLAFTSLSAADVDGKWTAQVAGRDGQTREQTFTFKADGEKLTGTISGMMGGADTEIGDRTRNVLIEAANFDPVSIARTASWMRLARICDTAASSV